MTRGLPLLFALVMLAVPYIPGFPPFWVTLLNFIGLASLVAIGLVVLTGVGGMTSFGQAAFVGFGAYTTAILTTTYGLSPWVSLPVALLFTMLAAVAIGLVTVRLSGHYLPLGTIAWGMAFFYLFGNMQSLGGFNGISGIPPLSVAGVPLYSAHQIYPVVFVAVLLALVLTRNLLDSRTGRAMRALRKGTTAAEAFGINVARTKLAVFVYAAVLAGLSGWLFAHIQRGVTPTAFGLNAGIEYLLMAVVGGAGHLYGALLGAGVVVILKDQLQNILPRLFGAGGNFEMIVFGALLVLGLQFARDGLWPYIARFVPSVRRQVASTTAALPATDRAPAAEVLLDVDGATKTFGGLVAVNNITFEVRSGEILGLLGPNGAGKSTTFNLVTGVAQPTRGEIRLEGKRIDRLPPRLISSLGVARTFQHVKLVPDMTVLENVAIGAHLRTGAGFVAGLLRANRTEEQAIFQEAARNLDRIGLGDEMHQLAGNLSLGSSRLVEIARALCLSPKLLLLDEPAAGLRRFEKEKLARLLQGLRAEGMSILLVEHDMEFVMGLTDRIVVLDFGTKLAEGAPVEIQNNPAVQEAYLGGVL
nr:branched-chain amino acid ABC transporter ATP-binding protein/permease [Mesorhizobium australicum]